jgi:hypothetical protein
MGNSLHVASEGEPSLRIRARHSKRHGERSDQWLMVCAAHSGDLSAWQELHALGILYFTVAVGLMNLNVWERTKVLGGPSVSILGMWQATHALPALPSW